MPLGRLVPWLSWDEWHSVRAGLFSADATRLNRALDQVSAWEARGKLPLGADMTAAIQRMRLRDAAVTGAAPSLVGQPSLQGQSVSADQESMLRMQYALAIIRLVNGISDSAQKGTVAKSVAHLAETAGLPRILVDVRHEASHNELPSLALLRLAADSALTWLAHSYWRAQADHVTLRKTQIVELIKAYVESQRDSLQPSQLPGPAEDGTAATEGGPQEPAGEGSSKAQAQKLRRELLSQLLSKVQSSAALLVEPLLDAGVLAAHATRQKGSEGPCSGAEQAAGVWEATMQDLCGMWPSLCQLLLAGAVQRLADTRLRGAPLTEVCAWVELLLDVAPIRQHAAGEAGSRNSKKRKKATAEADEEAPARRLWQPSRRLLLECLSTCMQALAAVSAPGNMKASAESLPSDGVRPFVTNGHADTDASGQSLAALQRAIAAILRQLKDQERQSLTSGFAATPLALQHLQSLNRLAAMTAPAARPANPEADHKQSPNGARTTLRSGVTGGLESLSGSDALRAAAADQHALLQQAVPATRPVSQRRSGWHVAEAWEPCAIGMLPCALSPAGAAPVLALPVSAPQQAKALASPALQTTEERKQAADVAATHLLEESMSRDLLIMEQSLSYFARFEAGNLNDTASDGALKGALPVVGATHVQNYVLHQQLVLEKPVRVL